MKRIFTGALIAIATGLVALTAAPQTPPREFYELSTPLPTDSPGKIEVTDFFWYGCPHCYALEPYLEAWVANLPKDVVFRRVPAIFNDNWAVSARLYYTMESMGVLPRLHRAFFDAIHKDNLHPINESQVLDWVKAHGVDPAQFRSVSKSSAVESQLKRAAQIKEASEIHSVPAIMVQGRYVVVAQASPAQMLQTADRFIDEARKQLSSHTNE